MPTSLYDITVPPLLRGLRNLDAVLAKGEAYAKAEGVDPVSLLATRLAPDMYPLTAQVQRASDTAKFTVVRIGGVENVPFADDEQSFADLHARIAKTSDFLKAAPREAIDGKEEAEVVLKAGGGERRFRAIDYALGFVLPNFFFHATTAYDLLRHRGVPLGKMDYLGRS
ncbi:DUF1993 domain-containing protein [Hansschlegelia zhihuaiae]|uniref:DUF1993 domain-containing protein n=1 Tax=Hansschlegelia zhihuaiae TaxID=405005 RepID=A0A4Q0MP38_9HYPH|nr:DUF1993 domain-containing protein [Hansschlegelia zhihuaiae]RXF74806.1 DUF1993 domain-containing protein [Hansschlegelia zhihuaiae]